MVGICGGFLMFSDVIVFMLVVVVVMVVVVVKVDSSGNGSSSGTTGNSTHTNKCSSYLHGNVDALNI